MPEKPPISITPEMQKIIDRGVELHTLNNKKGLTLAEENRASALNKSLHLSLKRFTEPEIALIISETGKIVSKKILN